MCFMKFFFGLVFSLLLLTSCSQPEKKRPTNILIIVADDLGFTDLGCYGSEINTPNLNALAAKGLRSTSFYTAPTCSPTRAMLLSGVVNHRNGYGTMEGDWADNQKGLRGYEGYLKWDVVTFPKLLQDAGYHTSIAGKWHQAFPAKEQTLWPYYRGFTRSFIMAQGGAGHYYDKQPLLSFIPEALYVEDTTQVATLSKDFYSSKNYADKTIQFIDESRSGHKPFFHFLSFTAPHWPLQVPDENIDTYKDKYEEGYEVLAQKRFERAQAMGIIPASAKLPALTPNIQPWNELTDVEKRRSSRAMEIYAAMIDRMDFHVGRVIAHLKEIGEYENTLIVFMADNGAEGNSIMGYEDTGEWVETTFDTSFENMGRLNSYTELGAAWASVSSLPFKWYKAFATEGGVRAPLIIQYPKSKRTANTIANDFLSVMDLAPTFLELADVKHPGTTYQGRKVYPMNGMSMLPWLHGEIDFVHPMEKAHVWELYGRIGVRLGDWKAEKMEAPYGTGVWELYNLKEDLIEENNLANNYPEKLQELIGHWKDYEKENAVTLPDRPTAYSKETYWNKK